MKRPVLFDVTPRVLVYRWHEGFYLEHADGPFVWKCTALRGVASENRNPQVHSHVSSAIKHANRS